MQSKKAERKVKERTLTAVVTYFEWSYIVNDKGNAQRTTLEGYGSCTPADILQKMIDTCSREVWEEIYRECDKTCDVMD